MLDYRDDYGNRTTVALGLLRPRESRLALDGHLGAWKDLPLEHRSGGNLTPMGPWRLRVVLPWRAAPPPTILPVTTTAAQPFRWSLILPESTYHLPIRVHGKLVEMTVLCAITTGIRVGRVSLEEDLPGRLLEIS